MGWINNLLERRRIKARALFRYHDGAKVRYADPAEVWRSLLTHPEMDFGAMMPLAEQGQEPETAIVLKALSEIFGVAVWDDATRSGLTTWELLDLVRQFDEYLTALKKSTNPSRMPLQLLVYGQSSTDSPKPGDPPGDDMSSSAASSSTPNESSDDEASPSSEPSPTPSGA
jgi:hypothetical protein